MSSRSSNSLPRDPVLLGRVRGHRGGGGELTVKVFAGDATIWSGLSRVLLENEGGSSGREYAVTGCRAYADRLVLKLVGVEDAGQAAVLKGERVLAPADQEPRLPDGAHLAIRLVGLEMRDTDGTALGRVRDVWPTGGADLLVVDAPPSREGEKDAEELLVPFTPEIVLEIDEKEGAMIVRLPVGLLELNRATGGE